MGLLWSNWPRRLANRAKSNRIESSWTGTGEAVGRAGDLPTCEPARQAATWRPGLKLRVDQIAGRPMVFVWPSFQLHSRAQFAKWPRQRTDEHASRAEANLHARSSRRPLVGKRERAPKQERAKLAPRPLARSLSRALSCRRARMDTRERRATRPPPRGSDGVSAAPARRQAGPRRGKRAKGKAKRGNESKTTTARAGATRGERASERRSRPNQGETSQPAVGAAATSGGQRRCAPELGFARRPESLPADRPARGLVPGREHVRPVVKILQSKAEPRFGPSESGAGPSSFMATAGTCAPAHFDADSWARRVGPGQHYNRSRILSLHRWPGEIESSQAGAADYWGAARRLCSLARSPAKLLASGPKFARRSIPFASLQNTAKLVARSAGRPLGQSPTGRLGETMRMKAELARTWRQWKAAKIDWPIIHSPVLELDRRRRRRVAIDCFIAA